MSGVWSDMLVVCSYIVLTQREVCVLWYVLLVLFFLPYCKSRELFTAKTPEAVRDLVTKGNAKVDIHNHSGATPLIVHAGAGNVGVVKKLIQFKANVDLQDSLGLSALMVSCKLGHLKLVQVLVSAGAILDLKEREAS